MGIPINILIAEDSVDDADLVMHELQTSGFDPTWKRVETEKDFLAELEKSPDIILSDFSMPQFSGLQAVELLRQTGRDIPFILVSGTMGEDSAVEAMKLGATDYLLKDRLARLSGAVKRALEQKRLRDERKRAAEELRESEEKFRLITETIDEVFWMADAETSRMLYISPAYERVWGRSCASLMENPKSFLDAIHGEDRERVLGSLASQKTGQPFELEYRIVRPTGTVRWIRNSGFPVRQKDGKITHYVGAAQDITERKRARDENIWKTAFLEAQIESAPDAILVVNDHGKIILRNQRLFQLFKVPPDLIQDDDDAKLLHHVTQQMKEPKEFSERVAYLYAHPDEIGRDGVNLANGTILERYSAPVRDKAGKYYGRIWTFRDITEQRKLEAQFHQSQKMETIGQLAGGVAHDFNNILSVVQMQADLILDSGSLATDQLVYLDEIMTTVQRAATLTRQLLLFSRQEMFQPRDLDLSESITHTAKMLGRILGDTVPMQLKLAVQPMLIHADAGMMDQVLLNLAVNARDAMPNGGRLVIETSGVEFDEFAAAQSAQARPGSFVCLSISDSGSGIPPEVLPKIFEPFFTTKDIGKGTGLGLATVFGIVQRHQGWINVYSEIGHGTRFRIYFPRLARGSSQKNAQSAQIEMRGGNETILLVEDDPALRLSIRKALAQLGYRILEAPTGFKALEAWNENRDEIRLLLTDLVMPDGMTGRDLGFKLVQEKPELKVIYMSGYSTEVMGKDFSLKEGVDFLTKPFQARKLAQTIRARLDG